MPKSKAVRIIMIAALVIAVLLGLRYFRQRRLASLADPFEGLLEGKATIGSITRSIDASGELKAGKRDILYIPYPVKVTEMKARPGDTVLKGGLIVKYESSGLEEEVDKAQSELTSAQQEALRQASGSMDLSMLSSIVPGLGASTVKDTAQLESSYKKLTDAQGKLTYRAPFDGILTILEGRQGQELSSTSASNPLAEVIAVDSWYVLAPVSEFDVNQVKLDMTVDVVVPALGEQVFKGKVTGIILNPIKSGGMVSYMVRVDIEGVNYKMKPGMSADVSINAFEKAGVLAIPHGYSYEKDGGFWVIALDEAGKPAARKLTLGEEGDDSVEVLEGLVDGETIYQDTTPDDDEAQSGGGLFNFRARMTGGR